MGVICSDVPCCYSVKEDSKIYEHIDNIPPIIIEVSEPIEDISEPTARAIPQNLPQNAEILTNQPLPSENELPDDPQDEEFLLQDIETISQKFLDSQTPKRIYLTLSEEWKHEMRILDRPLHNYYTKTGDNQYTRNLEDNSKFQILFQQRFPNFGIFFYQICIQAYEPKNGCEFTFGVVNYLQAIREPHCKGADFEESFTFKKYKDWNSPEKKILKTNILLKLEIDRDSNPQKINSYVDGQLNDTKPLKAALTSETVSLSPYIQTQGLGVTFSWQEPLLARSASYSLSSIIEVDSNIYATQ